MSEAILRKIDRHKEDWGAEFYAPVFNQYMGVYVGDPDISTEAVEKVVQAFNQLDQDTLAKLFQFSWDYCKSFCDYVGDQECPSIQQPEEILQYIEPIDMMIEMDPERTETIIRIELNCDWEVEHGLEWLIRDQQILYVGSCEVPDAWKELSYYENYSLNFAFGNNYDNL